MKRALYLLDSYAFIYRSYFAFMNRPLRNSAGMNVSAAFGYFRFLFALLEERRPGLVAAVFDAKGPTFRHEMYTEYKATRQKTPEDLHAQIPLVEEILKALGMPILRKEGYEADDIIASLATRCARENRECWIVSGDKDLLQLVGGTVRALRPGEGFAFREFGAEEVRAEWGVGPERILDYLSLTGDSSDNIPGVSGIGDKTALKLLSQYEDLDHIYASLESVKPDGLKKKLESGRESAFLSRQLVTLASGIDSGVGDMDELSVSNLDFERANPVFLREGMKSLVRESRKGISADPGSGRPAAAIKSTTGGTADPAGTPGVSGAAAVSGTPASPVVSGAPAISGAATRPGQTVQVITRPDEFNEDLFASAGGDSPSGSPGPREAADFSLPGEVTSLPGADFSLPGADFSLPGADFSLQGAGDYAAITTESNLAALVDECISAGFFAFDCETDGLDDLAATMVGFSLSWKPRCARYIPLKAPDTRCIPKDAAFAQLSRLFSSPATVAGHNFKFDWHILQRSGIEVHTRIFDTMIAAWMLDAEGGSFSLENLAAARLGYRGLSYQDIVPKGSTFDLVGLEKAAIYASEDADFTLRLAHLYMKELKESGLEALFTGIEMEVLPILARMEARGICLRPAALRAFGKELDSGLESLRKEIIDLVGHDFNISSTKQLQEVLFTERKLPAGKKTKTGYSTDISVLEELAALDPVPAKILRHRSLAKLKSTYVDTLAQLAENSIAKEAGADELPGFLPAPDALATGRIHTHYLQTGAATGRLSSRDPNLQNIPIRDEEGRRIRAAFVAAPGQLFISADYSQIELVVLAHLSGDPGLAAAFRDGVDVHRRTASLIFGIPEAEVGSDQRRIAKTINFGVIYGMSAFRLARDLGLPRQEAQAFIDAYFKTYSGVLDFIARTVAETEKTGYATTILGRRRPIPAIRSSNKTEKSAAERVAVNTPIQGSAADIVKLAMIRVERALAAKFPEARLLLQVHDELIVEVPHKDAEAASQLIRTEMESAMVLSVPLKVGVEIAASWGEMH